MSYLGKDLKNLKKEELLDLLYAYDEYIIEIFDRQDGSIPACISEFFYNDFQEIKEEGCL